MSATAHRRARRSASRSSRAERASRSKQSRTSEPRGSPPANGRKGRSSRPRSGRLRILRGRIRARGFGLAQNEPHARRGGHRHPREHRLRRVRGDARRASPLSGRRRRRRLAQPQRPRLLPPACRGARGRGRELPTRAGRDPSPDRDRGHERVTPRRARAGRARPVGREGPLRPSRRSRAPRLGRPGSDGAVPRRRSDDHAGRDPRRARAPAIAARGDDVRAGDPRGHGLADVRHDARSGTPTRLRGVCATARVRTSSPPTCTRRSPPPSATCSTISSRSSSRLRSAARRSCSRRCGGPSTSRACRSSRTRSST